MREISELIYETCKTYLITQGKFILVLWVFIGLVVALYFGRLAHTIDPVTGAEVQGLPLLKVVIILLFSVIGILGSYSVAWFGIRVNTYANSRTAFASLEGKPYGVYAIAQGGHEHRHAADQRRVADKLFILLFIPTAIRAPASSASRSAVARRRGVRIAGGIFTKMPTSAATDGRSSSTSEEDDARNPGVIADCNGYKRRRLGRPSADGFEGDLRRDGRRRS